jgi:nucleotide-binding universal stress UspA family protein
VGGAIHLRSSKDELEKRLCEDAEIQSHHARRICSHAGVEFSSRIEVRQPLEAILEAAEEADLLGIGNRGLGTLSAAVLGRLFHRVISVTRSPRPSCFTKTPLRDPLKPRIPVLGGGLKPVDSG